MNSLFTLFLAQNAAEKLTFWEQLSQFFGAESPADLLSWEFWLVLTILFMAGEILTAGFLLGALTPGTLLAGLFAAFDASMSVQLLAFSGGTVIGLVILRPLFLKRVMNQGDPSNVEALVKRNATVIAAIPANGIGEVKIMSESWRATSETSIEAGSTVQVQSVAGNTLTVTPV